MEFRLKRIAQKKTYTIGHLYREREYVCDTLEPAVKARKHPAIAPGRYAVVITKSPRFGRWLPLLLGVTGRSGIRIHPGNRPEHTQGCILPGENREVGRVVNSAHHTQRIKDMIVEAKEKGEGVFLTVEP